MKPAPFKYFDPRTVAEAVDVLARYGGEGKVLAGGQSLMPVMNMRLARLEAVVDLNRIPELDYVRPENGGLAVGAMARQRELEHNPLFTERLPVLRDLADWIAHPQIRNRGTIGGSIAHADPAAELPAATLVLDAELTASGPKGSRTIKADEFFVGLLQTALAEDEVLTEVRFPGLPPRTGWSIHEIARRKGDFALAGVVALVSVQDRAMSQVRIAYFGVGPRAVRFADVERVLQGNEPDDALLKEAGRKASELVEPDDDVHATAEYRRAMAGVLTVRAVREAVRRARGEQT